MGVGGLVGVYVLYSGMNIRICTAECMIRVHGVNSVPIDMVEW